MTIREQLELSERTYLSSYAMLSQDMIWGTHLLAMLEKEC